MEKSDCDDQGNFYVFIKFAHQGAGDCFRLRGNGHDYGEFKYSQLPIKIGPLKGDCTTAYEFIAIDCHNELCRLEFNVGKVCCEQKDCKFKETEIKTTGCDSNKKFNIIYNFIPFNLSDSFYIKLNGKIIGLKSYKNLPDTIKNLEADCKTNYEFILIDQKTESCRAVFKIGIVCCEHQSNQCKITELKVAPQDCTGPGTYKIKLNFNVVAGTSFSVYDRNKKIGDYSISQLPISIDSIQKSNSNHDLLKVCLNDIDNCCKAIEYIAPNCLNGDGGIFQLSKLKIYPSQDGIKLHANFSFPTDFKLRIFDIQGKELNGGIEKISSNELLFKNSCINSGVYIVQYYSNGNYLQEKLHYINSK